MDLGWELTIILVASLSTPLLGFVIGTIVGGRRLMRRGIWLVVAAYAWFVAWMAIAALKPSATWYSMAENVNCVSLIGYPMLGGWFVLQGFWLQRAKWLHATKTCLHCGYDLRAQTVARCPECGQPTGRQPS